MNNINTVVENGQVFHLIPPGLKAIEAENGCLEFAGAKDKNGYGYTTARRDIEYLAHRVSLTAKLGRPIKEGYVACHSCDNAACINPDHLWEGTQSENIQDAIAKGRFDPNVVGVEFRFQKGEGHYAAKLTEEVVREIKILLKQGKFSQRQLAAMFKVGQQQISKIKLGQKWSHISVK